MPSVCCLIYCVTLLAQIAAPGGDNMYQRSSQSNGAILSTFPTGRQYLDNNGFPTAVNDTSSSGGTATYAYLQACPTGFVDTEAYAQWGLVAQAGPCLASHLSLSTHKKAGCI